MFGDGWTRTRVSSPVRPAGKEDEVVGTVLLLDHVQPFIDLAAQRLAVEILTEEDRLDCLAEVSERLAGWVLDTGEGEPAQCKLS